VSGARVEEVLGWRPTINSPGRTLGARATHGEACTGRTRAAAAESRGRLELGDDKWVPRVTLSGQRRGAAVAAGGPAGPKALAGWAAVRGQV
jgi:hypothetical protein